MVGGLAPREAAFQAESIENQALKGMAINKCREEVRISGQEGLLSEES